MDNVKTYRLTVYAFCYIAGFIHRTYRQIAVASLSFFRTWKLFEPFKGGQTSRLPRAFRKQSRKACQFAAHVGCAPYLAGQMSH